MAYRDKPAKGPTPRLRDRRGSLSCGICAQCRLREPNRAKTWHCFKVLQNVS
ncbi:MAG: hypothetical protein ACREE9_15745 [Stellaceae bacterium]